MVTNFWFKPATITALQAEMKRAVGKHGVEQTPLVQPDAMCLAIAVEEVGEVARAMTYDNGDQAGLEKELLQTAAMFLAWYQRVADR